MVRFSTAAVALLEDNRRSQDVPASFGVRIYGEGEGADMSLRLAFVDGPEDEDEHLEEHGTQFFVAAEVAARLADTVIDVAEHDPPQLLLRRDESGP